ncbi:MAG: glycosyltransferase family 8 protein [Rubricella sp.]
MGQPAALSGPKDALAAAQHVEDSLNAIFFIVDEHLFPVALAQANRIAELTRADVIVFLEPQGAEFPPIPAGIHPRVEVRRESLGEAIATRLPLNPAWPRIVYLKLAAADALGGYARILHLDVDTLVLRNPDRIWSVPMAAPIAAVSDMGFLSGSVPGLPAKPSAWLPGIGVRGGSYLNAGVLLIDVAAWRARSPLDRLPDWAARFGALVRFNEQDFLNHVFDGGWTELSPAWNFQAGLMGLGFARHFSPVVLHFNRALKPWQDGYGVAEGLSGAGEAIHRIMSEAGFDERAIGPLAEITGGSSRKAAFGPLARLRLAIRARKQRSAAMERRAALHRALSTRAWAGAFADDPRVRIDLDPAALKPGTRNLVAEEPLLVPLPGPAGGQTGVPGPCSP